MKVTHVNKSCVLLINLHQLLVCFVPHCRLGIGPHGNQIWYTLCKNTIKDHLDSIEQISEEYLIL